MNETIKSKKEAFVSGLKGTSVIECVFILVVCLLLETVVSVWHVIFFQLGWRSIKNLCGMVTILLGLVLILTVTSDWVSLVLIVVLTIGITGIINSLILSRGTRFDLEIRTTIHIPQGSPKTGFLFVSKVRGCFLLTAAITILAVDFNIFPRRWAKTETYGTGIMDLGVGTFAIFTGMVWPHHMSSKNLVKKVTVLLFLGTIRLVTVKFSGYNEHESEYGRHWNFFYTLAVVVLIGMLLSRASSSLRRTSVIVILVGIIQHIFLVTWNYEEVAIQNKVDRGSSLAMANKEGLISVVGYILLWLVGRLLFHMMKYKARFWCTCILVWSLMAYVMVDEKYLKVSRRTANLAYVVWTSSCVGLCLVVTFLMDIMVNILQDRANFVNDVECPDIYSIVNRRALFHFLFTNVLTGLVNLSLDSLDMTPIPATLLLIIYTFVPVVVILVLDMVKVSGEKKQD